MRKIFNAIKDKLKKEYVSAPLNAKSLLLKAQKDSFLLRKSEIVKLGKDLVAKVSSPIKCKEKDILVSFYENDKRYFIDDFKVIGPNKIRISDEYYKLWSTIDVKTPWLKMLKVSYLTDDRTKARKLVVKNGKLFIKASIVDGDVNCLYSETNSDINATISFSRKKIIYRQCKPTILKDIETNECYILVMDNFLDLKLQKVEDGC